MAAVSDNTLEGALISETCAYTQTIADLEDLLNGPIPPSGAFGATITWESASSETCTATWMKLLFARPFGVYTCTHSSIFPIMDVMTTRRASAM